ASRRVHLGSKPRQDVLVQPDRDACLASRDRDHRPAPTLPEVVLLPHPSALVLTTFPPCSLPSGDDADPLSAPYVDHDEESSQSIGTHSHESIDWGDSSSWSTCGA